MADAVSRGMTSPETGQASSALSGLIHPTDVDTFVRDHWEKRPLVVSRGDPEYFADLLTLDDVDYVLSMSSLTSDELRVVLDGNETPVSSLFSGGPNGPMNALEALYAYYRKGSTIILNSLDRRWEPLKRLCGTLCTETSSRFQANVYITPAGAQGFKAHYDMHDVFVLQVHGTKRWRLYASPLQLPLRGQSYDKSGPSPGDPEQEFDLHAGDVLYLPRGIIHSAKSNEGTSVHVTIGAHPLLWSDLIQAEIKKVFAADVRFRKGLPIGFASDGAARHKMQKAIEELLGSLWQQLSPPDMVEQSLKRAASLGPPALRHHLSDLEDVAEVGVDTLVRRRPDLRWKTTVTRDAVSLDFHNKTVQFPARVADEVRFVAEHNGNGGFAAAEIPGDLDSPGRQVLIRALVREGFLTLG
ncbi:cupin domain-containing protein [Actinoplanes siamensis]|uniref:JmjC domain-containing protein n=1 Tax=Actinoplanes siamensis TaxID=1223317 RepID=A0A919N685_9ACTN|nr:cupin domain-containing protein [Actinoplanes siamensis]GIF05086.1 hypothetical protein Asi03nite_26240 [Actinoplanes siamensis]